ncbi:hypothetical protein [Oceanobacter mangrovi]|uniref:hypothetical protein n=1 Tax=Oceanobacter mangrovi TaxID=2862510 RepID=UPI001C8D9776|nr:hypothetical protein [Oceanobacter mangrovi]
METPLDRFKLLIRIEDVKMPWLEQATGIEKKRWSNVRDGNAKMLAAEIQALGEVWPEYAYWLASGKELPAAGQISPMTKWEQQRSQTPPTAG